jgi:hypothetical protein
MAAWLFAFTLVLTPTLDSTRPKCNGSTRGQYWPGVANVDPGEALRAARCGELWRCDSTLGRLKWRPVSVAYWRLAGKPAPEGCEIPSL